MMASVPTGLSHCQLTATACASGGAGGRRSGLYLVLAAALTAAQVEFTLPPFAATQGDLANARAHAALEAQEDLAAGMGLSHKPEHG